MRIWPLTLLKPRSDHQDRMQELLWRIEAARLQIAHAADVEELGMARASLQMAMIEMQRVIRLAKLERGIALRPAEEVEESYLRMLDHLHGRSPGTDTVLPMPARGTAKFVFLQHTGAAGRALDTSLA